ncbi:hypothetical protein [Pantoea agglomerans]|uniref:hypothetical protein n=1 Tax=Enterobacter agglomerans TaxID=549 RepID=UPI001ABA6DE6|nr:hypothetical protein [Pantoea agglomerans]
MAKDSQILAEAVLAIDYRYPKGTTFDSSSVSGEFFLAKLAGRDRKVFAMPDHRHRGSVRCRFGSCDATVLPDAFILILTSPMMQCIWPPSASRFNGSSARLR